MRRSIPCILLALLMVPAAQALINADLESDGTDVDLVANGGELIHFTIPQSAFTNSPITASLELTCTCDVGDEDEDLSFSIAMERQGSVWAADLSVDHPDLVAGDWFARATGLSGSGTQTQPPAPGHPITVVAGSGALADDTAPVLRALGLDLSLGKVLVGSEQSLQVTVNDALLRRVTHNIDGQGEILWSSPYTLAATNLRPDGDHTVTVRAQDRAGHETELSFIAYVDTTAPDVTIDLPDTLFQGVPNRVGVHVSDASNYTVRARFDDSLDTTQGAGGSRNHGVFVTPMDLGPGVVEITVTDLVGNRVRFLEDVEVVPLETDIRLDEAEQTDGGAIGGEELELTIEASQIGGVVDVPVNVTFDGVVIGTLNVLAEGSAEVALVVDLPVGMHVGRLALEVPADVNETDMSNQVREDFVIERFLARVIDGDDVYHIRADARGLPLEAVDEGGNTYALSLKDRGLSSVYTFEVDGRELFWNPESTVTTIPAETDVDEDSPGLPAVLLIAALVAIAARRR